MDYEFNLMQRAQELGYDITDISPHQEMQLRMGLRQIVDAAMAEIKRVAQSALHGTRVDYLKNLHQINYGGDDYTIILEDGAMHLEEGYGPFDAKPGLLHGPNAKISKDGVPYNIIPLKGSAEYGSSPKSIEFRVVTGNSPANSWIHPGFCGLHAFDDAAGYIENEIDNIIYSVLG
jgi:hypothetical protein